MCGTFPLMEIISFYGPDAPALYGDAASGLRHEKKAVSCGELKNRSEKPVCRDHLGIGRDQSGPRLTVRIKENEAMLSPVEPDPDAPAI